MSIVYSGVLGLNFEEKIIDVINKISQSSGKSIDDILESFKDKADYIFDGIAESFSSSLDKHGEEHIKYDKELVTGFEERLYDVWKAPLDRFNLLIIMCREIGSEINNKFRGEDFLKKSYQFEVATRIHAHAVHLACEVHQLAKGGYADGAMARWRSLHECAVISRIISESSEEVSKRYYYHKIIDDYKFSQSYSEHCNALGFQTLSESSLEELKNKYLDLLREYGNDYANDHGWSNILFSKKKVNFYELEALAELSHFRPFYKFSSIRVHLGSKSLDYKLSLSLSTQYNKEEILLSGPSNEGLIDPIQCTALSLIYVTTSLMSLMTSIDYVILEKTLFLWNSTLQKELIDAGDVLKKRNESTER
jgi:Family of unknown function (DUF5677)